MNKYWKKSHFISQKLIFHCLKKKILLKKVDFFFTFVHMNVQNLWYIKLQVNNEKESSMNCNTKYLFYSCTWSCKCSYERNLKKKLSFISPIRDMENGATLFSRNVVSSNRRFAEMQFCRIVVLSKKNCPKSFDRIVELAKLHNAERHFSESLFKRTSFSQIVVQPNVIFTNRRSAERRFPETPVSRTSFCRNCMKQNVISPNSILLFNVLIDKGLSKICVISYWVRVWTCFNMDTVRIRKARNSWYWRFD